MWDNRWLKFELKKVIQIIVKIWCYHFSFSFLTQNHLKPTSLHSSTSNHTSFSWPPSHTHSSPFIEPLLPTPMPSSFDLLLPSHASHDVVSHPYSLPSHLLRFILSQCPPTVRRNAITNSVWLVYFLPCRKILVAFVRLSLTSLAWTTGSLVTTSVWWTQLMPSSHGFRRYLMSSWLPKPRSFALGSSEGRRLRIFKLVRYYFIACFDYYLNRNMAFDWILMN